MAATAIGLDVGTNAVRAVEIELSEPPLIRRMGQVALPTGAVVDGEVADVAAVSIALQRLWTQAGFKSRAVRVGMSSARVIVRTIEMPRLSHDDLMSAIRLQLDDYVPLPAEETVFDIRRLDGPESAGQTVQLLLGATHREAVEPLVMAVQGANLEVTAVDVIPAALAIALTHAGPDQAEGVDILLSIGAGTVVVVAARAGEPVFSRTLTSSCGRLTTERIATRLAVGDLDAERYKRLGTTDDPTSAVATLAAEASIDELIDEVRASLAFYAEQPSARPVSRMLVTGGGSLLPGLTEALARNLAIEVDRADPFTGLRLGRTGFEPCDLPYLAPYMAAAVGVALGATRPKDRQIDLRPVAKRSGHSLMARRTLLCAGAVVLVGATSAFYLHGRSELTDEQAKLASATVQLADLQTRIDDQSATAGDASSTIGQPTADAVAASVAATNIDWPAVQTAVEEGGGPFGVLISSFQGVLEQPSGSDATPSEAALPGKLTLTATAPDLPAIADWLDSVAADQRFAEPWVAGLTLVTQQDGSTVVQFTMEMFVSSDNLVARTPATEVPA
jgi:type IV pilus assembly protein PilM